MNEGIISRGNRVIIPKMMRPDMFIQPLFIVEHRPASAELERFYTGREHNLRSYRWHRSVHCVTNSDLTNPVSPWSHIQIQTVNGAQTLSINIRLREPYTLTVVDHCSDFWEIDLVDNTTSSAIAMKIQCNFNNRYGTPDNLIWDIGPQFFSTTFSELSSELCVFAT